MLEAFEDMDVSKDGSASSGPGPFFLWDPARCWRMRITLWMWANWYMKETNV